MTLLDSIEIRRKMLDVRDTLRRFASHGDEPWPESVRPYMDALQKQHEASGEPVLKIAALAAKNATAAGRAGVGMGFIAAAVELIEPSNQGDSP